MTMPMARSAVEANRLVAEGSMSPADLVVESLRSIRVSDTELKAWVVVDEEGARRQAAGEAGHGPLSGVCIGVKDVIDVAGLPTGMGFEPLRDRIALRDAAIVARLRTAGAIILGKTTTAQFAYADPPATRSPWHPDRTPGGSSTGSAVAVAAGHVPVAVGTQTGGSLLRPAAYNGIVGFKPSHGLLPTGGVFPNSWSMDHVGFLSRSVEDISLTMQSIGRAATPAMYPRVGSAPLQELKVGVVGEAIVHCDDAVVNAFREALGMLEARGAVVETVVLPASFDELRAAHRIVMHAEMASAHDELYDDYAQFYGPYSQASVRVGREISATSYLGAQRIRRAAIGRVDALFKSVDVLALPSAPSLPPGRQQTGPSTMLAPFSLLGHPAVALPTGVVDRFPHSLQLVGPYGADMRLLDIAKSILDVFPAIEIPGGLATRE